jgi:hydrogenase-1 operon protein HyaF
MKDFPIPVVAAFDFSTNTGLGLGIGPGSQAEDETLDYLPMPQGMQTFHAPPLPEPEDVATLARGQAALREALAQLDLVRQHPEAGCRSVDLMGLPAADLQLINQVLGEGEVSAMVSAANGGRSDAATGLDVRVQESVFAGVWRVITTRDGVLASDTIELGSIPHALQTAARDDIDPVIPRWQGALPPHVQNAPALLAEIEDQWRTWRPGQPAHVVNLTLLPMSQEDIGFLDHHLGTGRVLILSRGYGNCRISNTLRPNCWRVVYYNSQDVVILNTVEVSTLPDVAQAAPEDLDDSHERLTEVLAWVGSGT